MLIHMQDGRDELLMSGKSGVPRFDHAPGL
jgi:hypothetical protein